MGILSVGQTFRTIDPVSKFIFGQFQFGQHTMLRMISLVNECCGYAGKDQLAYNAQYAVIGRLIDATYQTISLTPSIPLFIGNLDGAELFTPADTTTYSRTLHTSHIIVPTVYITQDLIYFRPEDLPIHAYYIYLPWNDILSEELTRIKPYYNIGEKQIIEYHGYSFWAYTLLKKGV